MLRSILNAPFFTLFTLKPTQFRPSSTFSNLNLSKHYAAPISPTASMSDVLQILGPLNHIFPASASDPFLGFLRKCIRWKNFFMGSLIHAHLIKSGLKHEILVSNVMLFVYGKAGVLGSAIQVFDEMPERDLVSWCTLISGYVGHGFEIQAFGLFKRMMVESSLKPNQFVVSAVLKGCSASGIIELGVMVHGFVFKSGLGFDRFVEIGLVDMYAKCGALEDALKMFYRIPVKSSVTWNVMISGYVQKGFLVEAVELCREMCRIGVVMDLVTMRVVANAAGSLEMFEFCKNLHVYSIKIAFDRDTFVVAELVRLLSKLGEVDYMSELFKNVKRPDASLYSLLISGYHLHGHRKEAVKLANELLALDLNLKEGALVNVLNLCLCREEGTQIHAYISKIGQLSCLSVGNALISMYTKLGAILDAKVTFLCMPVHDVVSWTIVMSGLVQNLQFGESLKTFHALRITAIQLDPRSISTILNACTGLRDIDNGQQIHALSLKLGVEHSTFVCSSLLHMYLKCGHIEIAARLFSCNDHDLSLTNVMTAGYCWNSRPDKALELFSREYQTGLIPDHFSLSTVLGACADIRSLEMGEQIHSRVVKSGFDISDVIVGNALINMYVDCGTMGSACKVFYSMPRWNVNSYDTLMTGYIQNKGSREALRLFYQMQQSGFRAKPFAFARILGGCADLAAIDLGKQIHASIIKTGLVSDAYIGNALVGMYAKSANTISVYEASNLSIDDDEKDGTKEIDGEDLGLLKLEKEIGNCSRHSYVNHFYPIASSQMYEIPLLFHEARSGLKLELLSGIILDAHKKGMLLDMIGERLTRNVGWINTLPESASVKFEVMQLEGIIPEHVILVLVFSEVSKFGLVDERYSSISSHQRCGTYGIHRASAWS